MPVSVQTSGIGTPSLLIVTEELLRLGARSVIRIGTCGAIGHGIRTGDIVIATSAYPLDGATRELVGGDPLAPTPDFELTRALVDTARARGVKPWVGADRVDRHLHALPPRSTCRQDGVRAG